MGVSFSRIAAALDPKLELALGLLQDQIQHSFSNVPDAATDGITRQNSASGPFTYTPKDTDKHVVCITGGGPITVALPTPAAKRLLNVIANGPGSVIVKRADGKPCSFGGVKVLKDAAQLFVADGVDWYLG